jgi:hypothetical protein
MSFTLAELRGDAVMVELLEWASARPSIQAMLLTSTRNQADTLDSSIDQSRQSPAKSCQTNIRFPHHRLR